MSWKMSIKTADAAPPIKLELVPDNQPEMISLVGPGAHGWVYRSLTYPCYYRLLPIDTAPLQRRDEIRKWIGKTPSDSVAPITHARQHNVGSGYFYVRYEVAGEPTLADVLTNPDPGVRLRHTIAVLTALPAWWQTLYSPLLPLPADIVFTCDGKPLLLALPSWRPLDVEAIFAAPERALYLAPELARGCSGVDGESVDRYAFGVALLRCFHELPPVGDAASLLLRVVNGTALTPDKLKSELPFWLNNLPALRQTLSVVYLMIARDPSARRAVDLTELAHHLEYFLKRLDPAVAAADLRSTGHSFAAFSLLQEVLLTHTSYELLLLVGEIAAQDLQRPLEAIDLFERAIAQDPQRSEAYAAQFTIAVKSMDLGALRNIIKTDAAAAHRIDARVRRDFQQLPTAQQHDAEVEAAYAQYLLWRVQIDEAVNFIYPRLFDGQKYMWWKFGLNLSYAAALLAQKQLPEARQQLDIIKGGLFKARQNQTVSASELQLHGETLAELEVHLWELSRTTLARK
jgi:tetratricopeptide (TPR) repeat protein